MVKLVNLVGEESPCELWEHLVVNILAKGIDCADAECLDHIV